MSKNSFLKGTTVFTMGLVAFTLFLNKMFLGDFFRHELALDFQFFTLVPLSSLFLIILMYFFIRFDRVIIPGILEKLQDLKNIFLELSQPEKIYISLLAGFSEELLFRGLMQPLLGITATSILFGLMHFLTFGYFLLAAAIGFYLGLLYELTGNIFIPVMVHAIYNVFAFNMLAGIYRGHGSASR
jgi:membrane protease YdiL (CAAX protease family)